MKSTRSHEPSPPPHERRRQTKSKFLLDRVFLRLHFPPDQIQTYRSHLTRSRRINRNLLLFPHVRFILVHLIEIIGPGNNAHDHGVPRKSSCCTSLRLLSSPFEYMHDAHLRRSTNYSPMVGLEARVNYPASSTRRNRGEAWIAIDGHLLFTVVMNETGIERERKNIISGYDL